MSKENKNVYIVDAVRTPRGRGKAEGKLHAVPPYELVAQLIAALRQRHARADFNRVEDLILGIVTQTGEQGGDLAKTCAQMAGLADDVPGSTVNRFCGSGLEAINLAFAQIRAGLGEFFLAGGVESMSRVALGSDQPPWMSDTTVMARTSFVPQGISADLIATLEKFSRTDVDAFAVQSQQKAARAWAEGRFARSIVPIRHGGEIVLARDEHMRAETTLESLSKLRPSFVAMGETFDPVALRKYPQAGGIAHVHHAGNSSGIVDGAGLVVMCSEQALARHHFTPRARILGRGLVANDPTIMLTGTVPASKAALAQAGLSIKDMDVIEINEAFASVVLYFMRHMHADQGKINPNGGAIAMGHPLGATGAMLVGSALDELERTKGRYALITLCIGGGMGIACVIERVS
jgi:acetyl-CoA C-acetyltransferase